MLEPANHSFALASVCLCANAMILRFDNTKARETSCAIGQRWGRQELDSRVVAISQGSRRGSRAAARRLTLLQRDKRIRTWGAAAVGSQLEGRNFRKKGRGVLDGESLKAKTATLAREIEAGWRQLKGVSWKARTAQLIGEVVGLWISHFCVQYLA